MQGRLITAKGYKFPGRAWRGPFTPIHRGLALVAARTARLKINITELAGRP